MSKKETEKPTRDASLDQRAVHYRPAASYEKTCATCRHIERGVVTHARRAWCNPVGECSPKYTCDCHW